MRDFIDKTSTKNGTPINRANLMAAQGFDGKTIAYNADGSFTITNDNNESLTIKHNADGSFTETFVGKKTIVKTITVGDNMIKEEIQ